MCLKGVSEVSKKKATHQCQKCKAYSDTKGHLCKPEKLKKSKAHEKSKAGKKTKGSKKGGSAKRSKKAGKKHGK
jgi:hypothetical protein